MNRAVQTSPLQFTEGSFSSRPHYTQQVRAQKAKKV